MKCRSECCSCSNAHLAWCDNNLLWCIYCQLATKAQITAKVQEWFMLLVFFFLFTFSIEDTLSTFKACSIFIPLPGTFQAKRFLMPENIDVSWKLRNILSECDKCFIVKNKYFMKSSTLKVVPQFHHNEFYNSITTLIFVELLKR